PARPTAADPARRGDVARLTSRLDETAAQRQSRGMPVSLPAHLSDLRRRMKDFIDGEVIPAEPVLAAGDEAARERRDALKAEAKQRDLWALGHPAEIGGGGLPFMDFV